jgi:flagellin
VLVGGDVPSTTATEIYSVTVNGVQFSVTNTAGSLASKSDIRNALVDEINKKKTIIGVTASAGDSLEELKLTSNTAGIPFSMSVDTSADAESALGASNLIPNGPAAYKPLGANDLMINGVPIRESTAQDDLLSSVIASSSSSSASAIAIANAINSQSSATGVRAQANPVVSETTVTDRYLPSTPARYSLFVNGKEISVFMDPTDTPQLRRTNVMEAINQYSGSHGVTAKDNGTGGLTLTTDGRNMAIWFDSSIKDLSAASFGLGKAGAEKQVSTLTFDVSAQTSIGKSATIVINDQSITVESAAVGDDFAELFKAKIEANAYLQNIGVEVTDGVMTFTSKVAGSGFTISGVSTDSDVTTAMDVETTTANDTGSNDVTAIYRATETSATAKTMYGTVRMISDPALLPRGMPAPEGAPPSDKLALLKATGRPFTISVGDDGFGDNSNFNSLGFEVGTFGGQSSAAMDPPRVGRLAFQVGSSTRQVITIDLADFGKNGPITSEITGDVDLNVEDRTTRINSREGASAVLDKLDIVMDKINATRATMGAVMNRLDHVINNLTNVSMNLSASRSAIEDADYAASSTELAKTQIMQQAATAVLAQANTSQQTVLKLLGG